jgi:hypothetical protein
MAALFAKLYNAWQTLPEWLQKGLRDAAAAAVTEFGVIGVADWRTALVSAGMAAFAVVRVEVLPPLLDWFLAHFGLHYVGTMKGSRVGPRLEKGA